MKSTYFVYLYQKYTRFKASKKNKKITKKNVTVPKVQNSQLKTKTCIKQGQKAKYQEQICISRKEQKDQLHLLKRYFNQTFYDLGFSNSQNGAPKEMINKFINISSISIEKLFQMGQSNLFQGGFIPTDILEYYKTLINQLPNEGKKITLKNNGYNFIMTQQLDRPSGNYLFKGRFITQIQREVINNHDNFIEKIRANQSKYKDCNSQLSEISQQLLFLSKVYMDNTTQIKRLVESMAFQSTISPPKPEKLAAINYYEIIIKKNIIRAFDQQQVDYFNYFKEKQLQQTNFYDVFQKIKDQNQFINYLKSKKPKKGKSARYGLPTACSCCFSDYYQNYNPFVACENCNLRCHKLCLNLKQKSCGNCTYQRILKTEKQTVQFCFICKQKGQMNLKISEYKFAHFFCLLLHNLWSVSIKKVFSQNQIKLQKSLQNGYIKQNPAELSQTIEINVELIFASNLQLHKQFGGKREQDLKRLHGQKPFKSDQKHRMRIPSQRDYYLDAEQMNCQLCKSCFHQNYYVQCQECSNMYHGYCAFFQGFHFQKQNRNINQSCQINFLFHCCTKQLQKKQKLKKKRQFILNKNRFLFQNI